MITLDDVKESRYQFWLALAFVVQNIVITYMAIAVGMASFYAVYRIALFPIVVARQLPAYSRSVAVLLFGADDEAGQQQRAQQQQREKRE